MTDKKYYLLCAFTALVLLMLILTFYYNYCYNRFLIIESVQKLYIQKGIEILHFNK